MEKPLGFSDAVASGSIKRISSFFLFIWDLSLSHCYGLNRLSCNSWGIKFSQFPSCIYLC